MSSKEEITKTDENANDNVKALDKRKPGRPRKIVNGKFETNELESKRTELWKSGRKRRRFKGSEYRLEEDGTVICTLGNCVDVANFKSVYKWRRHASMAHGLAIYHLCKFCSMQFRSYSEYTIHLVDVHNAELFSCDSCGELLRHKHALRKHMKKHELGQWRQEYKCGQCDTVLQSTTAFFRHIAIKHKNIHPETDKIFSCNFCEKTYKTLANLKKHVMVHLAARPFTCSMCGRCFTCKSTLKTHMRTHTGNRPFYCKLCPASYADSSALHRHIRLHQGKKPFVCHLCDKGFVEVRALNNHIRVHTGEKPFSCQFCSRSFSQAYSVRVHERTHTGERPYVCALAECQKGFSQRGGLRIHVRCHQKQLSPSEYEQLCATVMPVQSRVQVFPEVGDLPSSDFMEKDRKAAVIRIKSDGFLYGGDTQEKREAYSIVPTEETKEKEASDQVWKELEEEATKTEPEEKDWFEPATAASDEFPMVIFYLEDSPPPSEAEAGESGLEDKSQDEELSLAKAALEGVKWWNPAPEYVQTVQREERERSIEKREMEEKKVSRSLPRLQEERKKKMKMSKKTMECEFCQKCFISEIGFKRHVLDQHLQQKRFVCEFCLKPIRTKHLLRRHISKHMNQLGWNAASCFICGKSFRTPLLVKRHLLSHSEERRHVCTECGRAFKMRASLILHERKHTGYKPYQCTYCPSSFPRKSVLKVHVRTHTGERPYNCLTCGATFPNQTSLRRHRTQHNHMEGYSGLYKCELKSCEHVLPFDTIASFKTHLKTHPSSTCCDICGQAFQHTDVLRRHVLFEH